jgi:hypothetical protein
VHRRTLLALLGTSIGAGAGLAGCTSSQEPLIPTTGPPQPDPTEDADASLRAVVRADERALIGLYAQAIAAYPQLTDRLRPLVEQHQQHFDALNGDDGSFDEESPDNPGQSDGTDPSAPLPTNDVVMALATLSNAERAAADQRTESCVFAQSTQLTRLLALIAASEASHAQALTQGGNP